jgi:hypothetical protein
MALRVAATLRVADHLAGGRRRGAPELAEVVHAEADALDRLLRHLVSVDVLARGETGRYSLTPRGECLREDHPSGLRRRLDVDGATGRADLCLVELLHAVRTGTASFPVRFGRPFWDDLAADPFRAARFDAEMGGDVARWAPFVVASYDWGSLEHVVDVGGGDGTLLAALLRAHPGLRGTVVDQPGTAEAARRALQAVGLGDRGDAAPGSFFDPLPPGAGGYLLSAILHNWDDRAAAAILRRCAEAAGSHGRVFVVERTGADGESPRTDMDLRVLAWFGGRERGVVELVALAEGAGLGPVAVRSDGDLSVVVLAAS